MNYELAKELKDAGFPCPNLEVLESWDEGQDIPFPTLSELIKWFKDYADNGSLVSLTLKYEWTVNTEQYPAYTAVLIEAKGCGEDSTSWETKGEGTTPEEAVARLWLALNKK